MESWIDPCIHTGIYLGEADHVELSLWPRCASDGADVAKQYGGQLAEAEVLLTSPPLLADVLESVPRLRWAQVTFAGVEKLMNRLPPGQVSEPN